MDISNRIEQLPGLLGLSTKEFCDRINITTQSYSGYKAGVKPSFDTTANILTAFPVSHEWLIFGKGDWKIDEGIVSESQGLYTRTDFNILTILDRLKEVEMKVRQMEKSFKSMKYDKT
jgi:transcriptional regulator with XRE-family HTH domain